MIDEKKIDEKQQKISKIINRCRDDLEELGAESLICVSSKGREGIEAIHIAKGCSKGTVATFITTLFENDKKLPMVVAMTGILGANEEIKEALEAAKEALGEAFDFEDKEEETKKTLQ